MTDSMRIALCQQREKEPKWTQKQLKEWVETTYGFPISQATVSNTLKRARDLIAADNTLSNTQVKRHQNVLYPLMEKALHTWFIAHQGRVNMSGELLQVKGAKFLKELYPDAPSFEFSNGWLDRFKSRYRIKSYRRFGESGSVDMTVIEEARPKLCQILDQYSWDDIYNMDETGLFYRMQADNSLATRQLEGRKQSKERLTAVVCCNGNGSHKLPLWILGKFQSPRCFKNINLNNLGCTYRWNKKAWMTQTIFLEWLKWFGPKVSGRRVLLLMDNCSAHVQGDNLPDLANIRIHYLPPNTTSKIQPCDAGIIRCLKAHYRRSFNKKILDAMEKNVENPEKINVLEGIELVVDAWTNGVKEETIARCFQHCRIRSTPEQPDSGILSEVEPDPEIMEELQIQIQQLAYANPMDIRNLLNYPEEQIITWMPSEEEIVEQISRDEREESNADEEDDSEEIPKVKHQDAIKMLESLKVFFQQQNSNQNMELDMVRILKDAATKLQKQGLVQSTLDHYFHPL